MKPAISIRQAVEHEACETGLVNFIRNYLPDYDFDSYIDGDTDDEELLSGISSLVDVDAPRELHTLEHNTTSELIWALRRIGLPDETVNTVCRKTAIFAAESVLHIFESKYPEDKRPRKAIEAAKAYLTGDISRDELRMAAYAAAATADADAADAADAAYAAAYAAYAAAAAADAAYAAYAAYAAAAAADAAYAAYAAYAAADAAVKKQVRDYFNALLQEIEV